MNRPVIKNNNTKLGYIIFALTLIYLVLGILQIVINPISSETNNSYVGIFRAINTSIRIAFIIFVIVRIFKTKKNQFQDGIGLSCYFMYSIAMSLSGIILCLFNSDIDFAKLAGNLLGIIFCVSILASILTYFKKVSKSAKVVSIVLILLYATAGVIGVILSYALLIKYSEPFTLTNLFSVIFYLIEFTLYALIIIQIVKSFTVKKEVVHSYSTASVASSVNTSLSTADILLNFKNLLDEGAITQEEFDAKKKELLNL